MFSLFCECYVKVNTNFFLRCQISNIIHLYTLILNTNWTKCTLSDLQTHKGPFGSRIISWGPPVNGVVVVTLSILKLSLLQLVYWLLDVACRTWREIFLFSSHRKTTLFNGCLYCWQLFNSLDYRRSDNIYDSNKLNSFSFSCVWKCSSTHSGLTWPQHRAGSRHMQGGFCPPKCPDCPTKHDGMQQSHISKKCLPVHLKQLLLTITTMS